MSGIRGCLYFFIHNLYSLDLNHNFSRLGVFVCLGGFFRFFCIVGRSCFRAHESFDKIWI